MSVGLDALKIFKATGTVEMREKYPSIYREDIDKSCHFNPNDDYLYAPPSTTTPITHTSPWYCFTLIPNTTIEDKPSLDASLYLMQFLNWAVYYYRYLKSTYDSIPKYPKQEEKSEANSNVRALAVMVNNLTGKEFNLDELNQLTEQTFNKNDFVMKPSYFLKLCRLFARAWFEEQFYGEDNTTTPVRFAHYASCYIQYCSKLHDEYNCIVKSEDENAKKEVARLFDRKEDNQILNYSYNGFTIELEKYLNPEGKQKKHTYTISISQHGCRHIFYLTARLHHHQYKSSIK